MLGLFCADLHKSDRPPLARSNEEDWLDRQASYLRQLDVLQHQFATDGPAAGESVFETGLHLEELCPVFIVGDIFDKWIVKPETVNMVMKHLPKRVYAIAGNHDLPNHRYEDMKKSSYGTLVEAGAIRDISPGTVVEIPGFVPLWVRGFPCGSSVLPYTERPTDCFGLVVALVHSYIWSEKKNTGYPGASKEQTVGGYSPFLKGYDIAVFGDNHTPFESKIKDCYIYNCGGFQRRRIDEIDHRPSVGLLYSDGTMERHYLDCKQDKFIDPSEEIILMEKLGFQGLVEAYQRLGDGAIDFRETLVRQLERRKVAPEVKALILSALGEKQK